MHSDNGALANSFPLARRRGEEKQEEEDDFPEDKRSFDLQAEQRPLPEEASPSPSPSFSSSSDRRAAAELLKSCGVRFYGSLSKKYPPAFIRAKVEEWRQDPSLGPGMLVRLIQGGGIVVGNVPPIERPPDDSDWHRNRYESGGARTDGEDEVQLWPSD